MKLIRTIPEYNQKITHLIADRKIGFIPTMGFLHEGHLSLIRRARQENEVVVVSIYVNPAQFGHNEDLENYPRDIERDKKLLESEGVDVLFAPDNQEMYPAPQTVYFNIDKAFTNKLCGSFREGHFEGVATIVFKLFSIIRPDNVYFGEKDYQQLCLIKKLCVDMRMSINVVGLPIVREPDGLAMSSRNTYLTNDQRRVAPAIYKALLLCKSALNDHPDLTITKLKQMFINKLKAASTELDVQYMEWYDRDLNPISSYRKGDTFIGVAVFLGRVRLIDNILC